MNKLIAVFLVTVAITFLAGIGIVAMAIYVLGL